MKFLPFLPTRVERYSMGPGELIFTSNAMNSSAGMSGMSAHRHNRDMPKIFDRRSRGQPIVKIRDNAGIHSAAASLENQMLHQFPVFRRSNKDFIDEIATSHPCEVSNTSEDFQIVPHAPAFR